MKTTIPTATMAVFLSFFMNGARAQNSPGQDDRPRVPALPMSEMQDAWLKTLERLPGSGLKGPYAPVSVLGTLMHNPRTMGPFLDYWVTSKLEMNLPGREQELVILRMGWHYRCDYVWKHHVPPAREYGVTDAEIEAVKSDPLSSLFTGRERALLILTDEMVNHRTIREEAWKTWGSSLEPAVLVDLVSLVSQYTFFALFNNSLQIAVEEPLKGIPGLAEP